MLQKYDRGASKHVCDIVTGDDMWICAYEPVSKQQSNVWVFQDEPNPTKVARARSTSKQMIACFFGKTEWQKCFDNWFKRIQKYIDLNGEYFEKS